MLIKKIIIDNIKAHEHFEFEPAENGLTAISGDNGAGKSTIVDCFAWSLYGTRPKGLKNEDLIRDKISLDDNKVQVQSIFELGNREYKVVRRILSKTVTECNVYSRGIGKTKWQKESGPAITHAETYIRTLLGTDEKGFLSSIFVQQKEVDQIVRASAKERGQVIEKLIGISSISEGINQANEEKKALQKAANIIQLTPLADAEKQLSDQKKFVDELKESLALSEETIKNIEEKRNKAKTKLEAEDKLQSELDELTNDRTNIKNSIKIHQENLDSLLDILSTQKTKKGKTLSSEMILSELNEIEKNYNKISEELTNNTIVLNKYEELFSKTFEEDKVYSAQKEYENEVSYLSNLIDKTKEDILSAKSQTKSLKEYSKLLKEGNANCKLCGQEIHNHEEELEKASEKIKTLKDEQKIKESELEKQELELKEFSEKLNTVNKYVDKIIKQNNEKENFELTKKTNKKLLKEQLELKDELDLVRDKYVKAKSQEDNKNMVAQTKNQVIVIQDKLKELNDSLSIVENKISSHTAVSKSIYRKMQSISREIETQYNNEKLNYEKLVGKIETETTRGQAYFSELRRLRELHENHARLTKQLEITTLAIKSLIQFKEQRVKVSIPALTDLATEIFNKFTEGKYIKLILTDKFETMIETKDHIVRSVKTLSGGELSAASLALRLAIALFLSDGEQKLLILDEVLAPMSEDRSQLILETIASVTKAQIILIAHNKVINSFADKVVAI